MNSTPNPIAIPDISLPEFEAAEKLKAEGKLSEARAAFIALIQRYPERKHVGEAQDLLGEVNISILLSDYPSPEKQEYVVRSGDVLARVAAKLKTTPELIMRTNNLSGTMLRIGQKLFISHSEFSHPDPAQTLSFSICSIVSSFLSAIICTTKSCPPMRPQKWRPASRKSWLGKTASGLASAAGNFSAALAGFGWPLPVM